MRFFNLILHPEGFRREIDFFKLPKKWQARFYNQKYPFWFEWFAFLTRRTALTPLTREAERSLSILVIGKRNHPEWFLENLPNENWSELKPFDNFEGKISSREMKIHINIYLGRASWMQKRILLRSMKRAQREENAR